MGSLLKGEKSVFDPTDSDLGPESLLLLCTFSQSVHESGERVRRRFTILSISFFPLENVTVHKLSSSPVRWTQIEELVHR